MPKPKTLRVRNPTTMPIFLAGHGRVEPAAEPIEVEDTPTARALLETGALHETSTAPTSPAPPPDEPQSEEGTAP